MSSSNPYAADLGEREPMEAFSETPFRIQAMLEPWPADRFERSYAPGKWSARRILIHLAQTELALGTRVRYALSGDGYRAQSFSQDAWLPLDEAMDGRMALQVYTTLRRMNAAMFRALSPAQRARAFEHPEYGTLTVEWVIAQMAGHDIHHMKQLEATR